MKEIEIPFGAKDSELKGWEYTIPEGMEAEIKDGKIVVREKESEDERIREEIVDYFKKECECLLNDFRDKEDEKQLSFYKKALAWLEKQKEPENVSATTMAPSCFEVDQKEQKPAEPTGKLSRQDYLYQLLIDQLITYSDYEYLTGKKPTEWSDEDENIRQALILLVSNDKKNGYTEFYKAQEITCDKVIAFLKSLRPSWKPSKEQMKALERTIRLANFGSEENRRKALESLHDQLEKLTQEG